MPSGLLSVVVVTRDAMGTLPDLLVRLEAQKVPGGLEVVAVDLGSRDGTAVYWRGRAASFTTAGRRSTRARAWNLGLDAAKGDWVVLLSQDALPAHPRWAARLAAAMADPRVAAAFGRPVTRVGASPPEAPRTLKLARRSDFDRLDVDARAAFCRFESACACVRREVWRKAPFRALAGAEGVAWARAALLSGHALVHVPSAEVYAAPPAHPLLEGARRLRAEARAAVLLERGAAPRARPQTGSLRRLARSLLRPGAS